MAALDHYTMRKRKSLGDFVELRAKTRDLLRGLASSFDELDRLIESPQSNKRKDIIQEDDIRVLPLLRSAAVVKGLRFPAKVRSYFETMMASIGYQPLPTM